MPRLAMNTYENGVRLSQLASHPSQKAASSPPQQLTGLIAAPISPTSSMLLCHALARSHLVRIQKLKSRGCVCCCRYCSKMHYSRARSVSAGSFNAHAAPCRCRRSTTVVLPSPLRDSSAGAGAFTSTCRRLSQGTQGAVLVKQNPLAPACPRPWMRS